MANFPALSRSPGASGYAEELPKESVAVGGAMSGLPVLNELFTFDPTTWKHTLYLVSQADKETVMTFYKANKGVPFNWDNAQEDDTTYEVVFIAPPVCKLDRIKARWRITIMIKQYSPL